MQGAGGYSYLWGPASAFLVIGVLALVLRWAYSDRRDSLLSRRPRTGSEAEYGLLTPVAAPPTPAEGRALRDKLHAAGVRGTLVETDSGLRLLVFGADVAAARRILAES